MNVEVNVNAGKLARMIDRATDEARDEIGGLVLQELKRLAAHRLHPTTSSKFINSFGYKVTPDGEIHVGTDRIEALWVEWGVKPHRIEGKPVLAWTDLGVPRPTSAEGWKLAKEAGVAHFARSVMHTGIEPRRFMRDSVLDNSGKIMKILEKHMVAVRA